MIVLAAFLLGALVGAARARARKGNRLDVVQYGLVHAILFALIGLFLAIGLGRVA